MVACYSKIIIFERLIVIGESIDCSAGKIPDITDQVGADSLAHYIRTRTGSGTVRVRINEFGNRGKLKLGVVPWSCKVLP